MFRGRRPDLKNFLKGMETPDEAAYLLGLDHLKNFLKGMETRPIPETGVVLVGLKNFLKGMETSDFQACGRDGDDPQKLP